MSTFSISRPSIWQTMTLQSVTTGPCACFRDDKHYERNNRGVGTTMQGQRIASDSNYVIAGIAAVTYASWLRREVEAQETERFVSSGRAW